MREKGERWGSGSDMVLRGAGGGVFASEMHFVIRKVAHACKRICAEVRIIEGASHSAWDTCIQAPPLPDLLSVVLSLSPYP